MDKPDFTGSELTEKEQRILTAAIEVFSEKGFSAATTNEIAKNAGVAEGTIFRYFKTKKDLLRGILIQMISTFSGKIVMSSIEKILENGDERDFRTVLKDIIQDRIKLVDSIFPMARVVMTEAIYHEDVREALYENIIKKALEAFRAYYDRMVEKGILRSDIDAETMMRCIIGNVAVFIAQNKLFGSKFSLEDKEEEMNKLIDIIMYGIAKPQAGSDV